LEGLLPLSQTKRQKETTDMQANTISTQANFKVSNRPVLHNKRLQLRPGRGRRRRPRDSLQRLPGRRCQGNTKNKNKNKKTKKKQQKKEKKHQKQHAARQQMGGRTNARGGEARIYGLKKNWSVFIALDVCPRAITGIIFPLLVCASFLVR